MNTITIERGAKTVYQGLSPEQANTTVQINRRSDAGYTLTVRQTTEILDESGSAVGARSHAMGIDLNDQQMAALAAMILEDVALVSRPVYEDAMVNLGLRVDTNQFHKDLARHHARTAGFKLKWADETQFD